MALMVRRSWSRSLQQMQLHNSRNKQAINNINNINYHNSSTQSIDT
jgi:hypothetical protein